MSYNVALSRTVANLCQMEASKLIVSFGLGVGTALLVAQFVGQVRRDYSSESERASERQSTTLPYRRHTKHVTRYRSTLHKQRAGRGPEILKIGRPFLF